ncbi:MAG: abortive phage resistance protein, partial [Desulfovibrio sp.]|nr:abortive phage resistance protein [Desulfovibrio sp.]
MNINASIIDQRLTGIIKAHKDWLPEGDINRKKSSAFILLCMSTYLDLPLEEAVNLLTDGGEDTGVDGIHIGDIEDGEFLITLFQGKYSINDVEGKTNFPEQGIQKVLQTLQVLFDPYKKVTLDKKIAPEIEEIRSFISDAY